MTPKFTEVFNNLNWDEQKISIYSKTEDDVLSALKKSNLNLEDFKALISPAAESFLETMAQKSVQLTRQRFGNTMQIFAPLYLSNVCSNICTYCGFSINNKLRRKTLTDDEILAEAKALKKRGLENILLVTGEAPKTVGATYLKNAIELLKPHFAQINMEVQPLIGKEYEELIDAGLHGVSLYQETYHKGCYEEHHLVGNKKDMAFRLNSPDALGQQNIHKIALGVLIGLEDWRTDSLFCANHLRHLQKYYWKTRYAISFPRLRPCEGSYQVKHPISDRGFVQLILAWRLFDPDLDLTLSTRESQSFRDQICKLGITSMSAESSTQPGGYSDESTKHLEQFEIDDDRTIADVSAMLKKQGFEVVTKDWGWN